MLPISSGWTEGNASFSSIGKPKVSVISEFSDFGSVGRCQKHAIHNLALAATELAQLLLAVEPIRQPCSVLKL
jgi:hypothetical protein